MHTCKFVPVDGMHVPYEHAARSKAFGEAAVFLLNALAGLRAAVRAPSFSSTMVQGYRWSGAGIPWSFDSI